MATGTYKPTTNTVATYGENSASTGALQQALNASGALSAPIAVDNKYGDQTKGAYDSLIGQGYTYTNGAFTKGAAPVTTNPVVSGTNYESDVTATGNEIKNLVDSSGIQSASDANTKLINDRITALDQRRAEEIASIKADYEIAAGQQADRQNKDYAGQSTSLITAGGGFLGTTGSQTGVLNNLRQTHEQEKTALMGKRDAAIQAAKSAYDEKQFGLAQLLIKEAKDTEQEIYNRTKDHNEQVLSLARESRAQQEFDMGVADKKVEAFASMDDATFSKIDPKQIAEIDKSYYPGYTVAAREVARKIAEGKTLENDIDLKNKLQTLINKTPAGQKITLPDGTTYMGMKRQSVSGSSVGMISPQLAFQLGVPSLAGKDESDTILSLSFEKAPAWYHEFYKSSSPDVYDKLTAEQLNVDWNLFKEQPDIKAYTNSSVVTNRINSSTNSFNISPESIAEALDNLD